jgi:fatty-acyl-CoA synthase
VRVKPGQSLNLEGVRAFCQGQIAHYKVPRYVEVVDAFPTTVTGKIQKFIIRDEMIAKLGLRVRQTA